MKALIVDDEEYVIEGLKFAVNWKEINIDTILSAQDGEQGFEVYSKERPDIIITDIYMKPLNGIDFITLIRKQDKDTPIIIFSGSEDFEFAKEAISLGVIRFLSKPSIPDEVKNAVREAIDDAKLKKNKELFIQEFNNNLEQNLNALRTHFFEEAMMGDEINISVNNLNFLKINPSLIHGGVLMVIKLYKNIFAKNDNELQWFATKFSITDRISKLFVNKNDLYVWNSADNSIVIVLTDDNKEVLKRKALKYSEDISEYIKNNFNVKYNIGISKVFTELETIGLSKSEASYAIKANEENGYNKIYEFNEVEYIKTNNSNYYMEKINFIIKKIIKGETDFAKTEWTTTKDKILNDHIQITELKILGVGLVNAFILKEKEELGEIDSIKELIFYTNKIEQLVTKDEIISVIDDFVNKIVSYTENYYNKIRSNKYVVYIKEYVENNYASDIYFSNFANELNISKNYLSNVFKKATGSSFTNYLTNFRIEKAKELLKSNAYLVCEVCEMVGYNDSAYFSRIFKQTAGVSPMEYMLNR